MIHKAMNGSIFVTSDNDAVINEQKNTCPKNISAEPGDASVFLSQSMGLKEKLNLMMDFDFKGNIKPHAWFHHVRFPNGKPDPIAMDLLSEIVYWYRPKVIREESTGKILGIQKKFKSDKLQRSVVSFSEHFGFSSRQVSDGLGRLEDLGLISREYRTIKTSLGKIPHVLFIDINASEIVRISRLNAEVLEDIPDEEGYFIPLSSEEIDNLVHKAHPIKYVAPSDAEGLAIKRKTSLPTGATYTEITTQSTTTATVSHDEREVLVVKPVSSVAAAVNNKTVVDNNPLKAEPYLEDVLTEAQKMYLAQAIASLHKSHQETLRLTEEIEEGLIDPDCFPKCGRAFYRKLRAILNAVSSGQWTPPVRFFEKKKQAEVQEHQQKAHDWQSLCLAFEDAAEKSFQLKAYMKTVLPKSTHYQALQSEWQKTQACLKDLEANLLSTVSAEKIQHFYQKLQDKFNVN